MTMEKGIRVTVGMSGGVDSSAAALVLQQKGYEVEGVTLRLRGGRLAGLSGAADQDIEDARRVCEVLGIPHRVLDLSDRFCACVVDEFAREYLAGRTPNPCVTCNRAIKFGAMLEDARAHGSAYAATGHYARREFDEASGRWRLYRVASGKDQSYVLYGLSQDQLAGTLFPLWGMEKEEVRALAQAHGCRWPTRETAWRSVLSRTTITRRLLSGTRGAPWSREILWTKKAGCSGGTRGSDGTPSASAGGWASRWGGRCSSCASTRRPTRVVLGEEGRQMADELTADEVNFLSVAPPEGPIRVEAKIRYQAPPAPALLEPLGGGRVHVRFDKPQRSVTPGQAVVFYDGDLVLGGGRIR